MWKARREDEKPSTPNPSPNQNPQPTAPVVPAPSSNQPRTVETPRMDTYRAVDVAHIGKSVIIKGELSGSEDLYLDGEVEGNIDLHNHNLVIGPNGRVRANVFAKDVVIHGKVDGNVNGVEKVELKKSALLNGDINTQRIVIEDGAFFKGAIDIHKAEPKPEPVRAAAPVAAAPVASATGGSAAATTEKK
jgi:cytoskeletal protein CcmA (bactofilin family)